MIRAIVCDMDGTLLGSKEEVLPKTKEVLIALQKQGIRLLMASGRNHNEMLRHAKALQMDQYGGYMVEVNGMGIYNVEKEEREIVQRLNEVQVQELIQFFMGLDVEMMGMVDDSIYSYIPERLLEEKQAFVKERNLDLPLLGGIDEPIYDYGFTQEQVQEITVDTKTTLNKMIVIERHKMDEVKALANKILVDFELCCSYPECLEIMPKGVSKGNTLSILCERLGIHSDEVIVFGDGENDISMFQYAKHSVMMGNGISTLLPYATQVTKTNDEEGIYEVVKDFLIG